MSSLLVPIFCFIVFIVKTSQSQSLTFTSHFVQSSQLSTANWETKINASLTQKVSTLNECVSKCQYHGGPVIYHHEFRCNAVTFDPSTNFCHLAKLDFIENVDEEKEAAKDFIIRDFDQRTLKKSCKDGKPCCSRDEVCANEVGRQACIYQFAKGRFQKKKPLNL